MNEEQVLNALACLTNGALSYYQAPQTVLVRDELIRNYITNLQKQNAELKDNRNKLKEWLEEESKLKGSETAYLYYGRTLNKMQEIEGEMNEEDFEIEQDFNEDAYLQYLEEISLEKRILEEEENE